MTDIGLLLQKEELDREDIIRLLRKTDRSSFKLLLSAADKVRKRYFGRYIHLRGIIEFSNYCEQNCLYCGLRAGNSILPRFRMNKEQILKTAEIINSAGIKTVVLQSGEDFFYSGDFISSVVRQIKYNTGAAVTLSLGERKFEDYELWKKAGADRYLLKHETGNPELYPFYHQGQRLEERLDHLRFLKSVGYQIGSGNLIGLPHQTFGDIAGDILLCKELGVDMASFSPFIPSVSTPLGNYKSPDIFTVLKVMSVARIVLKDVYIPVSTALASLHREGRKMGLLAGANVIMPNFTPPELSVKYEIYPDKKADNDINLTLSEIMKFAEELNLKLSRSRGDSIKIRYFQKSVLTL